jgi:hypothetical protein
MSKLSLENISKIYANPDKTESGFFIKFNDERKIHLTKRL